MTEGATDGVVQASPEGVMDENVVLYEILDPKSRDESRFER